MSFWSQSYRIHKILFFAFLLFVAGQAFFIYKGVETFPFWNYGMYSAKLVAPEKLETYTLIINGKELNNNNLGVSKTYIDYQLRYYIAYKAEPEKLGLWLKNYLQSSFEVPIEQIELVYSLYDAQKPYTLLTENVHSLYPTR
jgi:hypothetical protein